MFFYLDYRLGRRPATPEIRLLTPDMPTAEQPQTLQVRTGAQRLENLDTPHGQLVLLGDPIIGNPKGLAEKLNPSPGVLDEAVLLEAVRGHYYWFFFTSENLLCGSAFGAIFPVYYRQTDSGIQLCSSAAFLASRQGDSQPNSRNLLERLLFNYPVFNSTWWKGISLLEAHRHFHLSPDTARIEGTFSVSDHFGPENPSSSAQRLRDLVELFEEEVNLFLPGQPFAISFTGGFDGRTLVAAAQKSGREFLTYSFGRPGASDVTFPEMQARKLNIPYQPILLDEKYLEKEALNAAHSFLELTEYNGNLGRPHYEYAARELSKQVDYILTGNFGSELFRAMHEPGVMMTKNLIDLFDSSGESWKDKLTAASRSIGGGYFQQDMETLIADLERWLSDRRHLMPNQRFYDFVFNELFRKYFGPELVMQSHYFNNRTPFLSFRFFRELNRTRWAGVHSQLFEKNKSKRMKGQVFYSSFLRHAHRKLYHLPTSKGYSPADVLEPWRLPLLAGKVLYHKRVKKQEPDSNAVVKFLESNREELLEWIGKETTPLSGLLPSGVNWEEQIKWYTLAMGWKAAGMPVPSQTTHNSYA
ncbi:MAG: hypothetical protein H6563_12365 [Lewinellaceae bacterium]|nr:hypothetical protein [Lewinellaceae bacterium]